MPERSQQIQSSCWLGSLKRVYGASFRTVCLANLGLFVLVVAVHSNALRAGFVWDDVGYITENYTLQSWNGLYSIWFSPKSNTQYYPTIFTAFWAIFQVWGLNPFPYHCLNLLLHALNAVLVWAILRRFSAPGAWVAAAAYGIHPVQVQTVMWACELKNTLSGTLAFLSVLAWLGFHRTSDRRIW